MKEITVNRLITLSVGALALASPLLACASNVDIGTVASNVTGNFSDISKFMTGGAYVLGAAGVIHGLHRWWQKAHDQGNQIKMHSITIPIGAGGALIAVAATAGVPVATMFGTGTSNGTDAGTTTY